VRNPLRAALVWRAEDWPWSSLGNARSCQRGPQLTLDDRLRRGDWVGFVNAPMTETEAEAIRVGIRRGRPYGSDAWTPATAIRLGVESSLRSRGALRPTKTGTTPIPRSHDE
jgi:putative transposase